MKKKRDTIRRQIQAAEKSMDKVALGLLGPDHKPISKRVVVFCDLAKNAPKELKAAERQQYILTQFRKTVELHFVDAILTCNLKFFDRVKDTLRFLQRADDELAGKGDALRLRLAALASLQETTAKDPQILEKLKIEPELPKSISELRSMFPEEICESQIRRAAKDVGYKIARIKVGRKIGARNRV